MIVLRALSPAFLRDLDTLAIPTIYKCLRFMSDMGIWLVLMLHLPSAYAIDIKCLCLL